MKIAVIGCGEVGSTLAYIIMQRGYEGDVLLFNRSYERALGTYIDLQHAAAYHSSISFEAHGFEDLQLCRDCDIIVITVGKGLGKNIHDRNDLAVENAKILIPIIQEIRECDRSLFLIITNPVDNMTFLAARFLGQFSIDATRVIGLGTTVESARYRCCLGQRLNCDPMLLYPTAFVIGEHGDGMVMITSLLRQLDIVNDSHLIRDLVRGGAQSIRRAIGSGPKYTIALCAWDVIAGIIDHPGRLGRGFITVSGYVEGNNSFGVKDICLSLPWVLSRNGLQSLAQVPISDSERRDLITGAAKLKNELVRLKNSIQQQNVRLGEQFHEEQELNNLIYSLC